MDLFLSPEEIREKYSPKHEKEEQTGDGRFYLGYSGELEEPVELDFRKPKRCMIVCEPGAGKSYGPVHRIIDHLYLNGFTIFHLQDKRGELREIHKPNPRYRSDIRFEMDEIGMTDKQLFMPFHEKPFGWDEDSYSRYSPEVIPPGKRLAEPISFELTDFKVEDVMDILRLEDANWAGREVVIDLYDHVKSRREKGEKIRVTETYLKRMRKNFEDWVDDPEVTPMPVVGYVIGRLMNLVRRRAFEGEYVRKFTDILGKHIILDWSGYITPHQNMLKTAERDIFFSYFLVKTIEWAQELKESGKGRKIAVVLDDSQGVVMGHTTEGTTRKYSLTLQVILNMLQDLRKDDFSVITAFQGKWGSIPEEMWDFSNLIIAGKPKHPRSQNALAKGLDLDAQEKKQFLNLPSDHTMRIIEGQYEEREEGFPWFISYPPLSKHKIIGGI